MSVKIKILDLNLCGGKESRMNIIYEDKKIIVVNKPAGQLVQSGKSFELDLTSEVINYRKNRGESCYAAVINRLDRPVSGIVLFAKDRAAAADLSSQMQAQGFCKQYHAVVCGTLPQKTGEFVDYLQKDARAGVSRVVKKDDSGAKPAKLFYEAVKEIVVRVENAVSDKNEYFTEYDKTDKSDKAEEQIYTIVKIRLITGRHHQIRVQFASRGLPLLGDMKYGSPALCGASVPGIELKKNEIALCASSLTAAGHEFSVRPEWLKE